MPLLRWSNPGHDTRRATSLVRGAGCRETDLRIRRRENNVLDIPFYRSGDYANYPAASRSTRVGSLEGASHKHKRTQVRRLGVGPNVFEDYLNQSSGLRVTVSAIKRGRRLALRSAERDCGSGTFHKPADIGGAHHLVRLVSARQVVVLFNHRTLPEKSVSRFLQNFLDHEWRREDADHNTEDQRREE